MRRNLNPIQATVAAAASMILWTGCGDESPETPVNESSATNRSQGAQVFRHDTFGNEPFWTDTLRMHEVIEQAVDPMTALAVDLKVDSDNLPPGLLASADLETPAPPEGSFHPATAAAGEAIFNGKARCATCHIPPTFTDAGKALHAPGETGMDALRATRGTTDRYRTTPLRALWQHPPYFHDGSAASLLEVVEHYDSVLGLGLTVTEKVNLVEYLKSL